MTTGVTPQLEPGTYTHRAVITFVIDLIKEEGRRLDMSRWVTTLNHEAVARKLMRNVMPECGTVACVGGWIMIALRRVTDRATAQGVDGGDALHALGFRIPARYLDDDQDDLNMNPEFVAREEHWEAVVIARHELENIFGMLSLGAGEVVGVLEQYVERHPVLGELTVTVEAQTVTATDPA